MNKEIQQKAYALIGKIGKISFPINVRRIATQCGYNVKTYTACRRLIEKLCLTEYSHKCSAFSFKHKGHYYILVSDELNVDSERKAIAHEIGHIQLHNINEASVFGHSNDSSTNDIYELEADLFALSILAPLPLIANRNIDSKEDIRQLTQLSIVDSTTVFENLIVYRNEFNAQYEFNKMSERFTRKSCALITPLKNAIAFFCIFICALLCASNAVVQVHSNDNLDGLVQDYNVSNKYTAKDTITTYYWTDDGDVYHLYHDCQSLKNSTKVHSGDLIEAEDYKERACKFCENRSYRNL